MNTALCCVASTALKRMSNSRMEVKTSNKAVLVHFKMLHTLGEYVKVVSRGCGEQDEIESVGLTEAGCATDVENIDDVILDDYIGLTVRLVDNIH